MILRAILLMRARWCAMIAIVAFVGWAVLPSLGQAPVAPRSACEPFFPSDSRIEWTCREIGSEKILTELLGPHLEAVLRFNRTDRVSARDTYLKVPVALGDVDGFTPMPGNLDRARKYPRYIFILRAEQFLGAYEFGVLKFSLPVTTGWNNSTPTGIFKVLARDRWHKSSIYDIADMDENIPYPMWWGLKFYVNRRSHAYWLHSSDLPGNPATHGCVGLYDEEMQKKFYGYPAEPKLMDAKRLYQWIFPDGDEKPREYPRGLDGVLIEIR